MIYSKLKKKKGKETLFIHGIKFKAGSLWGRVGEMNVGFWGKPEYPEKRERESRKENQQTQPTWDAGSENRTRVTLVGGECSHHYAIPAPPVHSDTCLAFILFWSITTEIDLLIEIQKSQLNKHYRYLTNGRGQRYWREKVFSCINTASLARRETVGNSMLSLLSQDWLTSPF